MLFRRETNFGRTKMVFSSGRYQRDRDKRSDTRDGTQGTRDERQETSDKR